MLNVVNIQGRLTSDPKDYKDPCLDFLKAFFTIAVTNSVVKDGEFHDVVTYIDCACNLKFVSEKARLLKKGDVVTLSGRLRNNNKPDITRNIVVIDVLGFGYPEPGRK